MHNHIIHLGNEENQMLVYRSVRVIKQSPKTSACLAGFDLIGIDWTWGVPPWRYSFTAWLGVLLGSWGAAVIWGC